MLAEQKRQELLLAQNHALQLEDCILSFFDSVAEIKLVTNHAGLHPPLTSKNTTVIINFGGSEQGFLALNLTEPLVRQLTLYMLGDQEELPDSYLLNALGEAANMLTLSLLERISQKNCHTISIPAIIRDDNVLLQKLTADIRGYTCTFFHGAERVLVKLVMHPPDCVAATTKPAEHSASKLQQVHRLFFCPRFSHPCRREHILETGSPHTARGIPYVIRPGLEMDRAIPATP